MEKIKQGYQQTDIGLIPTDWEVVELGDVSKYAGGSQPYLWYFSNRCLDGYIRLIQIRDYKTDKYAVYIPNNLARKTCNENDIMIGRYGPPIFQILRGLNGAYNVALIKAIPNEKIDQSYFYYTLKREDLFQLIELLSRRSSGQTGVDLVGLKAFKIGLPTKSEQFNIATALSNIDNLIATLDKKITKKQQIKQGAMQQLLTGKKRLAGFSGEWVEKKLGDCFNKVVGGGTPSRSVAEYWNGNIPWATVKDFASFNPKFTQENITSLGLHNSASHLIPKETPITSTRMGLGKIMIYSVDVAINQDMKALFISEDYEKNYIIQWFIFSQEKIELMGTGSTVKGIRLEQLNDLEIYLPPTKSEQTAIAQILTDMANEISRLEADWNKYKQIKAGMMQQLLTGKIRLVN